MLLLLCAFAFGQKAPIKFGTLPMEDLQMTVYAPDSSASAVVLTDFGESKIEYNQMKGFILYFERILRIKILTKEGLQKSNLEIPLYRSGSTSEKLNGLKGITYNLENGKIVETKLGKDGRFEERYDSNIDLVKITMPNVREGSVIDITYTVESEFFMHFQDWEFQSDIPVRLSEYRASIPEYFKYQQYMQGYIALTANERKDRAASIILQSKERTEGKVTQTTFDTHKIDLSVTDYRWVAQNVPAFREEPFITTYKDYISKINFELASIHMPQQPVKNVLGSWDEISRKFDEDSDFGGAVTGNGFLKKVVEGIVSETTPEEERVAMIYQYVKENYAWDGRSRMYLSNPLKKVMDEKKGSSAELNLLLLSMLEKANLKVRPVLISTRDHGFVREQMPVSNQFNTVIGAAFIGDKYILLDATERLLPVGVLPERCLNGRGLVVSKDGYQWINLEPKTKSKRVVSAEMTMAEGSLSGKIKMEYSGYNALAKRKLYLGKGKEEYLKDLTSGKQWELANSQFENVENISKGLIEQHELTLGENIVESGDVVYIDPFVSGKLHSNPFKSEKREYPVNYGSPLEETYLFKFKVPSTHKIEQLPTTKVFALPENGGRYTLSVSQTNDVIIITSIFAINKGLFSQTEYANLREFYNQVVAKQAEQIVLKKI